MKFRFHALGIPHTVSSREYISCAFTQKVVKFCDMMHKRGHEVIHYGHADSDVVCSEHVTVTNNDILDLAYDNYDWRNSSFKFDVEDIAYKYFYKNTIKQIGKRKQPGDFLLCFWGHGHRAIADAHPDMMIVEPGIGYPGGIFAPYRIFESHSILTAYYGMDAVGTSGKYGWYDAVIPNYFDVRDFDYCEEKDDYFLYLGRIGEHKGVHIAIQACQVTGSKLIIAGQGDINSINYDKKSGDIEYVGYADYDKRRQLMSKAKAQFVCTLYGEPFGGVQIEAMMSGTPVISTDWGCFTELNLHGITGYRCRLFEHFVWATRNIHKINPKNCRDWAVNNFSLDKVATMYEEYFSNIRRINNKTGWYTPNNKRDNLDWATRIYPSHPNLD